MNELIEDRKNEQPILTTQIKRFQPDILDELLAIADSSAKEDTIHEGNGVELRYCMVRDIFRLRQRMLPTPASTLSEAHRDWLKQKFTERGWRDNKRSTPSHKLVRIVTHLSLKSQRQRCSDLATILEHLAEIGQTWEGVVQYLKDQGGMDPLLYRLRHPSEEDGEDTDDGGNAKSDESEESAQDERAGQNEGSSENLTIDAKAQAKEGSGKGESGVESKNAGAGQDIGGRHKEEGGEIVKGDAEAGEKEELRSGESGMGIADTLGNEEAGNEQNGSPPDVSPPGQSISRASEAPTTSPVLSDPIRLHGMENGARYVLIVVANSDETGEIRLRREIDPSSQAALESLLGFNL